MKKTLFALALPIFLITNVQAQAPGIQWQKSLGGTELDVAFSIHSTSDGGYIVAGTSHSNDGDASGNHGFNDCWVVKLNATGNIQWQKSLGGTSADLARSIRPTVDGGYIVAGSSQSNDGDASGNHGFVDYWVVKLDASGAIQWQKSLGGNGLDRATSIHPTADGEYVVTGTSQSNDGDVSGNHGGLDYWVVKLNAAGVIQWQKSLGGTGNEEANAIRSTADGGYIVAGYSDSNDGDANGNHGLNDCWFVKLDATGAIQWQKMLGGTGDDRANAIQPTTDGGYVAAGYSSSNDGNVSGNHGSTDFWVVKLDATGNIQWQKSLGGTDYESASSIQLTTDGGYIVGGSSQSSNGDVSGNQGSGDCWMVKLSATGAIQWQKSFGGTNGEGANAIQTTSDGGFVLAGTSDSNNGDVSGNHGDADFWVVKLASIAPANDAACSATLIPADGTVQSGFTNANATLASGENALAPPNNGNDCVNTWCEMPANEITNSVWFRFAAPPSGAVEVSTCDMADFDTQIAVYSVGDCGNFATYSLLAANDDGTGCSGYSSKMNVGGLTPGQTYHIIVDGYNGETGGFSIRVTPIVISAAHEAVAASPLLAAYPNPTSGLLTIRLEDQLTMQACTLSDLMGKAVMDVQLGQPVQQAELDLGTLPKGVYLLQVRSGERVFSEKIIVR